MFLHRLSKVTASDFPKGLTWFNSEPLSLKKLLGKPVLIDFWTYSCINCIRTLPHLKAWHEAYAKKGLTIIGVHTPEFEFERDEDNVSKALNDFQITYPVVLDADYKIWNLYANRWWPRKFLIDKDGSIVYDHIGEGGYAETEQAIQKALSQIGVTDLPIIKPDMSVGGGICYRTTPETYLGFLRGRFGNADSFVPNEEASFTDPGEHAEDMAYLHGHWKVTGESIRHERKLPAATEYLLLKYSAFSVNVVMGTTDPGTSKTAEIEVEIDGKPIPQDMAGEDVRIGKDGRATVTVKKSRLYRIVNSAAYHRATLKIKTISANLELLALTFGGCKES